MAPSYSPPSGKVPAVDAIFTRHRMAACISDATMVGTAGRRVGAGTSTLHYRERLMHSKSPPLAQARVPVQASLIGRLPGRAGPQGLRRGFQTPVFRPRQARLPTWNGNITRAPWPRLGPRIGAAAMLEEVGGGGGEFAKMISVNTEYKPKPNTKFL